VTLLSFANSGQEKKVLNGVATDGHRNRLVAINAIIKGTATGSLTDICGRFSIPVDRDEVTLVFQSMFYDDTRTYEIRLKKSELINDTIVFQLGHWKVENPKCKKVGKRLKRLVIE
jgi:hypothetical protein